MDNNETLGPPLDLLVLPHPHSHPHSHPFQVDCYRKTRWYYNNRRWHWAPLTVQDEVDTYSVLRTRLLSARPEDTRDTIKVRPAEGLIARLCGKWINRVNHPLTPGWLPFGWSLTTDHPANLAWPGLKIVSTLMDRL